MHCECCKARYRIDTQRGEVQHYVAPGSREGLWLCRECVRGFVAMFTRAAAQRANAGPQ